MEKVSFLTRLDEKFVDVEILTSTITEFGITCSALYRKKGGFKKWFKKGYIISDGKRYICRYQLIADLKTHFKGKLATTKETLSEQKYSAQGHYEGERKATNWEFKIK